MSTGLFLDFIGIRMDSTQAEDFEFTINLATPDNGERYIIELSNATLTNIEGYEADDADLSISINRADLELVMMGVKPFMAQIEDGTATFEGNLGVLEQLASTMVEFDLLFEMLPGTKAAPADADDLNDFEIGSYEIGHE